MPLHAVCRAVLISAALLVCCSLYGQQAVPLVGFSTIDTSPVDHGCSLIGRTLRGSTHWFDHWNQTYTFNGTVPDLPEVSCSQQPVEIVSRSIEWEPIGQYRAYYIQFWLKVNTEGVGRLIVGGSGGVAACGRQFRGLSGYRDQKQPGELVGVQCFQLGNKYYDAEAELKKTIDQAKVCHVVFLDNKGFDGEYHQAWFNHDEQICQNMRAIDLDVFCEDNNWWVHPHAVPANDICGG